MKPVSRTNQWRYGSQTRVNVTQLSFADTIAFAWQTGVT